MAAKSQTRSEILQIAQIYDARVVDASPTTLLIEAILNERRLSKDTTRFSTPGWSSTRTLSV